MSVLCCVVLFVLNQIQIRWLIMKSRYLIMKSIDLRDCIGTQRNRTQFDDTDNFGQAISIGRADGMYVDGLLVYRSLSWNVTKQLIPRKFLASKSLTSRAQLAKNEEEKIRLPEAQLVS